jgi:hypothetical protein
MTKSELIEMLEYFKDDDIVTFAYPSNDYWGSVIVRDISYADYGSREYSHNLQEFRLVEDDDDDSGNVIILS